MAENSQNELNTISRCRGFRYVIKEGDTLYKISRSQNISLDSLLRANAGIDIYNLQEGQIICIPYPDTQNNGNMEPDSTIGTNSGIFIYVVKNNDTIDDVLERFDIDLQDLLRYNDGNGIMLRPGVSLNIPRKDM